MRSKGAVSHPGEFVFSDFDDVGCEKQGDTETRRSVSASRGFGLPFDHVPGDDSDAPIDQSRYILGIVHGRRS